MTSIGKVESSTYLGVCGQMMVNTYAAVIGSLMTVPTPTPSSVAIFLQPQPCLRSSAILEASTWARGLPGRLPLARAAAKPDRTRSRISSRSNSAMLAKMPNTRRPFVRVPTRQRKITTCS